MLYAIIICAYRRLHAIPKASWTLPNRWRRIWLDLSIFWALYFGVPGGDWLGHYRHYHIRLLSFQAERKNPADTFCAVANHILTLLALSDFLLHLVLLFNSWLAVKRRETFGQDGKPDPKGNGQTATRKNCFWAYHRKKEDRTLRSFALMIYICNWAEWKDCLSRHEEKTVVKAVDNCR